MGFLRMCEVRVSLSSKSSNLGWKPPSRTQINAKSAEMDVTVTWILFSNKFRAFLGRE